MEKIMSGNVEVNAKKGKKEGEINEAKQKNMKRHKETKGEQFHFKSGHIVQ